jgi:plasmid stability protein
MKMTALCMCYHFDMPAVQIRDVAPEVLIALKRRAARHERSLEGELRSILTAIAREEPPPAPLPAIELNLSPASPASAWRREEIYDDDGR